MLYVSTYEMFSLHIKKNFSFFFISNHLLLNKWQVPVRRQCNKMKRESIFQTFGKRTICNKFHAETFMAFSFSFVTNRITLGKMLPNQEF